MREPLGNKPKILKRNIEDGYIMRYFIRHVSRRDLLEIDKTQYDMFLNNPLYETLELKWFILGQDAINRNRATIVLYTDPEKSVTTFTKYTPTMLIGLRAMLRFPSEFVIT